ncbi:sel1 repeat family protein [Dactylosporangium sp. NBC_01737]|uniref:tetratricopeptide repeat protein n=1 Tax=Dactylosporangium sp. NBC_01737 TaxID=2975959 RepID=UPI002E13F467|nr:sel1 repeat family protein [Dactylosporangium sp. NBC_01737]
MDLDSGHLLAMAAGQLAADDPDLDLVETACTTLAGRIDRGDMMIGILPVEAAAVVVAGLSAVGTATAWITLGRCYLGVDGALLPGAEGDTQLDRARHCFARAATLGDRDGALLFARACADGPVEAQREAREHLRPHAATDAEARYRLGLVEQWLGDPAAAVEHHLWAAGQGNADAAFELYVLYSTGEGVPRDDDTGRTWLLRAADLGQPRALYNVGAAHATGTGFPADLTLAADYYRRAADAGNARAAAMLGYMHLVGEGIPADEATAARWFDTAEDLGHPVDDWLDQLDLDRPRA